MTTNNFPETIDIPLSGDHQTIAAILSAQYGHLDSGELRAALEKNFDVWNAEELEHEFNVFEHSALFANVVRKHDKQPGSVMFVDSPRLYFSFQPESSDA
jgi:hypothetical protein